MTVPTEEIGNDCVFEITANIAGGRGFWCFDPTVIVVRLRDLFPDIEIDPQDYAWRDYDAFKQRGDTSGAIQVAENDAQQRGPLWLFRIPIPGQPALSGSVERYRFRISTDEPFQEAIKLRLITFLEGLQCKPEVEIRTH
jgi:hypothetical protein